MKYIDADKLRAEIEGRMETCDATSKTPNQLLWAELSALLPFLDTLEEPVSEDLGEEIERASKRYPEVSYAKLARIAKRFAEWGAEHAKIDVTDFCKPIDPGIAQCIADHSWEMLGEDEKPVPNDLEEPDKDLEEAAMNYIAPIENEDGLKVINFSGQDIKDAFIAGAEWAMNQGVKTTGTISPRGIIYDTNVGYHLFLERYHNGDKVEVQIRKIE